MHAAWGLALSARIREEYGLESDAIWSDDGIIVHLPDADEPPGAELVMLDPDELEDIVVGELGGSALFGARFRENAGRALLIPRAYPGRRTPLWQQRLKSQTLLEVAKRYGQFPIVLETYRECLRDVLDVPGLQDLLRKLHSRELSVVEVETPTASPFASSLLFDYVATYMYEGDTPNAERRAAALALDRDLLRELLGQEELRDLIDPGALESVEADLQRMSERTRADSRRRAARRAAPRRRPHAATSSCCAWRPARDLDGWLEQLGAERRAVVLRVGGEERWVAAEDAGLYRDALGAVPPGGLPAAFLDDVPDAMERLVRRWARTHGPFEGRLLRDRYGLDLTPVLAGLERAGELVRGELRPGGTEREWCDPEVLRRLRRASLAALRAEIEPADQRALARFLPSWQGVDRHPPTGAGIDRLREVLVPLQGLALPAEVWERDVLPRRTGAYSRRVARPAVRGGRGRVGRRRAARPAQRQGRAVLPRGRRACSARRRACAATARSSSPSARTTRSATRLRQGACFFTDLLVDVAGIPSEELQSALWDLVWAGEVTNDAFAPLRSPRSLSAGFGQQARADRARRRRFGTRRAGAQPQIQGRWSLTAPLFAASAADPAGRRRAQAELLLERYGIVTREHVLARASRAASPRSTTRSARSRRSASASAATSSRASAARSSRSRARPSGCARSATTTPRRRSCSPPPIRRSPTARCSSGRSATPARPSRQAGAHVVLAGAEPVLYVERGGKGLQVLVDDDDARLDARDRGARRRPSSAAASASSGSRRSTASR